MAKIIEKHTIAPKMHYFRITAPWVIRHAQPGQFVIIRVNETGERIPLTIADMDSNEGSITLIVQEVGITTGKLSELKTGDEIQDVLGPLGTPSDVEYFGNVVLVGGGFGIAAIHLLAKALKEKKNIIHTIIGARTKELLLMENEMRIISDEVTVMTDDGSYGRKGLVTLPLEELLRDKVKIDRVIAVGPLPMMRALADVTRPYGVKTIISLNPIMVDGTGMCGGCRVQIGNETRFACTDGPEFDAHLVNFEELTQRIQMFRHYEKKSLESCLMEKQVNAIEKDMAGSGQV